MGRISLVVFFLTGLSHSDAGRDFSSSNGVSRIKRYGARVPQRKIALQRREHQRSDGLRPSAGWCGAKVLLSILLLPAAVSAQSLPPIDDGYNHYLIDNETFTGGFGMSTEDIQKFLKDKGDDCKGELCLKNYRDNGRTAAEIIKKASQKHGINPEVLIVTLQKESSLVTSEDPEKWQYRTAMGYGCPDDADCEKDFFGFNNQTQLAANLLRVGLDRACGDKTSYLGWQVHPRWYKDNVVDINERPTILGSCATASLYNYTPHRVDSAWRRVDGEFYYGNYNFVYLMREWFGRDPLSSQN